MTLDYQRELVAALIAKLFAPEDHQHQKQVNQVIDANDALVGRLTDGFVYLDTNYSRDGQPVVLSGPAYNVVSLSAQLMPRMNRLVQLRKSIEIDRKLISQLLFRLIAPCGLNLQDIRDALPECLVGYESYLANKKRIQPEAWTLKDNPRDLQQYLHILSKIETYYAMRFLY